MPAASSPAIIVRFHCVTVSACAVPGPAAAAAAGGAAHAAPTSAGGAKTRKPAMMTMMRFMCVHPP
jgi:hypothetical protein